MRELPFSIRRVTWTLEEALSTDLAATDSRSRLYRDRLTSALTSAGLKPANESGDETLDFDIEVNESRDAASANRWAIRIMRASRVIDTLQFNTEKRVTCDFETNDCTEELRQSTITGILNRIFESEAVVLTARDFAKRHSKGARNATSVALFDPANDRGVVAILPLDKSNAAGMDVPTTKALEEAIRTIAGEHLSPHGYTVLTGDTTLTVLEDNGVNAEKACDSTCALGAARELKASLFISGTVALTEGEFVGFVRLFETAKGRQIGAVQLEGKTVRDLRKSFETKASGLFAKLTGE